MKNKIGFISSSDKVKGYLNDLGVNSLSDCDYVWLGDQNMDRSVNETCQETISTDCYEIRADQSIQSCEE
jgi:hypothetical protein